MQKKDSDISTLFKFGVSIKGIDTRVCIVKPAVSQEFHIHWMLSLEKTMASLAGRLASSMVAGSALSDEGKYLKMIH